MIAPNRFRRGDLVRINCGQLEGLIGRVCDVPDPTRSVLYLEDFRVLLAIDNTVLELTTPVPVEAN